MNQIQKLNGTWKLYYAPETISAQSIEEVHALPWVEAVVPGNVELDLYRAGVAPDPFFGENLYDFRKYEFYHWWYEREFTVSAEDQKNPTELFLAGVDTYSELYLNGNFIGKTDNMMMEYSFDVSSLLIPGKNHLAIHIHSAVNIAREMDYPVGVRGPGWEHTEEMIRVRKPGHCFGWDIAPRLVSAGIWRGIELRPKKNTYLKEVYFATLNASEKSATVLMKCRFRTDDPMLEGFSLELHGECGESSFQKELKVKFCSDELTFEVPSPKLWWPKGYGEANLYQITVRLIHHGVCVDEWRNHLGIRTFTIDARFESGDAGEFKVFCNQTPILCKGSNWVPLDAFHSRDESRVEQALSLFAEAGCNLVRCWGGNVYEDHCFFDRCDREGILVWQDFSLACAIYPQDDEFMKVIEQEASQIVKKLRNHPSLLLWSGDNEVDAMYYNFGYHQPHVRNNRISREILPRVTASHDPMRYFLPSSPYIPLHLSGDLNVPEQHNWGPRDYFKGDFYKHSTAHFISEIGYHGCPAISSLKKFISPNSLWPITNGQWDAHNTEYTRCIRDRGYDRNQLMADQVVSLFGAPAESLEDLACLSQISQAEAKKFFIEMVRLKKWRRTGIIWWNMLDCWPQISDAVVDYYFHKKLAFYYIQRSQQPICLICDEPENWKHPVYLCNDSNQTQMVSYIVRDGDTQEILLSGKELSRANENLLLGSFKTYSGVQRLILMTAELEDGTAISNHFITGYPAFQPKQYRKWLNTIAAMPQSFDAQACWN